MILPPLPAGYEPLDPKLPADYTGLLWTEGQMRAYGTACAAAEREACIAMLTEYQVPVGNSRAGEMAADWTLDALREIRAALRARDAA